MDRHYLHKNYGSMCLNRKNRLIVLFILMASVSYGQDYLFSKDFIVGTIFLPDGNARLGYVKWFPAQDEKLFFRESFDGEKKKFKPEDLKGFTVDTLKFVSLSNFQVFGSDYALLGATTFIKHHFGQLLDSGKFSIYLVYFNSYNALSGTIQSYSNVLFEKQTDSGQIYAAYPLGLRMTDKKYEKAKEPLYIFFRDYPAILKRINLYKQQDDFFEIIHALEAAN